MIALDAERFDAEVDAAFAALPQQLLALLDNVVVLVEEEPPGGEDDDLLGLYDGIPLTERAGAWGYLPDRVTIFRGPHRRACDSLDELHQEIRVTLLHELGHHVGLDDARLHELGWA